MSRQRIIRHRSLPVEAPEGFWKAAKFTVYDNTEDVGPRSWGDSGFDGLLAVALSRGKTGADAIGFALEEEARLSEEKTRSTAIARLSDALLACSQAMKPLDVRVVVEGIVGEMQRRQIR